MAAGATRRPRGAGRWWPASGAPELQVPAGGVRRLDAADLVATVDAGCTLADLDEALAAAGVWVALDAPGPRARSLGGVLAAGGGGPLAARFGPPRDQVLGLGFVAGNGVAVKTGGRVVKNVAGFDLAKALVGSHGAFGLITTAHLRLRARPEADATRAWTGSGADVAAAARALVDDGALPAAFEVFDPGLAARLGLGDSWALAARGMGTAAGVAEELESAGRLVAASVPRCRVASVPSDMWARWPDAMGSWPVVVRVGADCERWPEAVALAATTLGGAPGVSVTVPRGTVRLGAASVNADTVRALRDAAASRGWPVTLERADPATLAAAGVFGALRPGVAALTSRLRRVFDPHGVFDVPLLGDAHGRTGAPAHLRQDRA